MAQKYAEGPAPRLSVSRMCVWAGTTWIELVCEHIMALVIFEIR